MLCIGTLELIQRSYISGMMNIARSSKFIKALSKEGLEYEGKEAVIVRSAALYCVGSMYLLYSFLSPTNLRIVSWFSGFKGDRQKGLEMLSTCFEEQGVCAGWAAISYIMFQADTRTFIGEPMDETEKEIVLKMITWAKEKYPNSLLFTNCEITVAAVLREQTRVLEIVKQNEQYYNLPAMKFMLKHGEAVTHWSLLNFKEAGEAHEACLDILTGAERESMIAYKAALAFLSYLQHVKELALYESDENTDEAEAMAILTKLNQMIETATEQESKGEKSKKKWGRLDAFGFKVFQDYAATDASEDGADGEGATAQFDVTRQFFVKPWILLDLAEIMAMRVRCTYFMSGEMIDALMQKLLSEKEERLSSYLGEGIEVTELDNLRLCLVFTELYYQKGQMTEAIDVANQGLRYEALYVAKPSKEKIEVGADYDGYFAMFAYYLARIALEKGDLHQAKNYLRKVRGYGKKHIYSGSLYLKKVVLSQALGEKTEENFEEIRVSARKKKTLTFDLSTEANQKLLEEDNLIRWLWLVSSRTIRFELNLLVDGQVKKLTKVEEGESENKVFQDELRDLPKDAKLQFIFDNSFSLLRSKIIKLRLTPKLNYTAE